MQEMAMSSLTLTRNDMRLLAAEPAPYIILTIMPLFMMGFIKPVLGAALVFDGFSGANGSEQAVPGMAVMFAFFLVPPMCFNFFREHGWNTWDRLRANRCSTRQLLQGKILVPLAMVSVNVTLVLLLGSLFFGLQLKGTVLGLAVVGVGLVVCVVGFALLLAAVSESLSKLNALGNLAALIFAGLGGALTPFFSLPRWAQAVAPVTPSYWAMRGFKSVIFDVNMSDVATSVLVLLGFGVLFAALAAARFRLDTPRTAW
jgi:ABC-2 type transport system permease protein